MISPDVVATFLLSLYVSVWTTKTQLTKLKNCLKKKKSKNKYSVEIVTVIPFTCWNVLFDIYAHGVRIKIIFSSLLITYLAGYPKTVRYTK